jgi:hypothetical protein
MDLHIQELIGAAITVYIYPFDHAPDFRNTNTFRGRRAKTEA